MKFPWNEQKIVNSWGFPGPLFKDLKGPITDAEILKVVACYSKYNNTPGSDTARVLSCFVDPLISWTFYYSLDPCKVCGLASQFVA